MRQDCFAKLIMIRRDKLRWLSVVPPGDVGRRLDERPRIRKFSIGGQGEAPQSYGPQARVLHNLNIVSREVCLTQLGKVATRPLSSPFPGKRTSEAVPTKQAHRMDGGHGNGGLAQ
jgi:hypothetical protein